MSDVFLDEEDTLPTVSRDVLAELRHQARLPPPAIVSWGAATNVGLVRRSNEDRWASDGERAFVVADGMGGHAGGELAAGSAVEAWLNGPRGRKSLAGWEEFVDEVNGAVIAAGRAIAIGGLGTTLVALEVDGDGQATVVNVGDSRAYRLRGCDLELLTRDHTVRQELLDAGLGIETAPAGVPLGALTAYIGAPVDRVAAEVSSISLRSADRLLLCTDGVHRELDHAVLVTALSAPTAQAAADELISLSLEAGGRDNATALVAEAG